MKTQNHKRLLQNLLFICVFSIMSFMLYGVNAPVTTVGTMCNAVTGQPVTVPVTVAGFTNIGSFYLYLEYDYSKIQYTSSTKNPLLTGNFNINDIDLGDGNHRIILSWSGGIYGKTLTDGSLIVNFVFNFTSGPTELSWNTASDNYCAYTDPAVNRLSDAPKSSYYIHGEVWSTSTTTPTISASGSTTFCEGGSVTLSSSAGMSYLWSNAETTQSITVSTTGDYSVTVTYAGGCKATSEVTGVTVSPAPAAGTDGAVTVCAGSEPTTAQLYAAITGEDPGGIWTGPVAGVYTYTVAATSPCTGTDVSTVTVTANPLPSTPVVTLTQPTCGVPTGTIELISPLGAGYEYSIGGAYQESTTFSGLAPNTYTLTVRRVSDNSCTSTLSLLIVNAVPSSPVIPILGSITHPTCEVPTGSKVLNGLPATGTWTLNPGNITGTGTSKTISGLAPGTYSYTVTNAEGCTSAVSASFIIDAVPGKPATPQATLTQPTCSVATGTITVTAPTGTGMTYSIDGSSYTNNSGIFNKVAFGTYRVTARNADGCTSSEISVTVNVQPEIPATPIILLNDNILHSNAVNGNQWYDQNWIIIGSINQDFTVTASGNYYVIVSNGICSSSPSNTINVLIDGVEQSGFDKRIKLYPNPTEGKVTLYISGEYSQDIVIDILNIQGQLIKTEIMGINENQINISLEGLPKGIFFIRTTISGNSIIRKIILN